ncbi:hypothetical protein HK405_003236 [Cladochytrium tenue]|nr:hypothetical protein HK405_003236 [Cladochytrium tenue]
MQQAPPRKRVRSKPLAPPVVSVSGSDFPSDPRGYEVEFDAPPGYPPHVPPTMTTLPESFVFDGATERLIRQRQQQQQYRRVQYGRHVVPQSGPADAIAVDWEYPLLNDEAGDDGFVAPYSTALDEVTAADDRLGPGPSGSYAAWLSEGTRADSDPWST